MSKRDRNRLDAFSGDGDLEEVADEIYGASAPALDVGRVVALPTKIDTIWADVKQPRRAVPASIRLHWNGNPADVLALLNQWHEVASKITPIDIYAILQGNGEGLAVEDAPAIFTGYVELLRLAASIRKDGLINPISIIEQDGRNLIETGERRWLAYHILHNYMGTPEWSKIPASRSDGRDYVWRQATENTARRQLNAIGMARQLALLIMETRRGVEGQTYNDFDELVIAGGCDRKFYAQIANGNIHRVPRGMGERIQGAMGLSMTQLSQYRRLLRLSDDELINDALWTRADVEDWAELTLREITATLTPVKVHEIVTREEWGLEDLRTAMEGARLTPPQSNPTPQSPPRIQGGEANQGRVYEPMEGDKVRTPAGHMGSVLEVGDGRFVPVQTVNGVKNYAKETLTLMSRTGRLDEDWEEEEETPPQPLPLQGEGQNARLPIQRVDMSEYSVLMHSNSWPERYKGLKSLRDADEILFVQTAYGHMAVGAKISYTMLGNAASHYRSENTAIGQVFFAMKEDVLHELSKHRPVAVYKDKDQPSVNTFWVKNVMDRKPTAPQVESDEEFERPVRRLPGVEPEPEVITDKADSVIPPNDHFYIIRHGSLEWQLLDGLREIGKRLEDRELEKVTSELINMTSTNVRRWQTRGGIRTLLDGYADVLIQTFEEWREVRVHAILQQIESAGSAGHDG